jgi:hypothetical protein
MGSSLVGFYAIRGRPAMLERHLSARVLLHLEWTGFAKSRVGAYSAGGTH